MVKEYVENPGNTVAPHTEELELPCLCLWSVSRVSGSGSFTGPMPFSTILPPAGTTVKATGRSFPVILSSPMGESKQTFWISDSVTVLLLISFKVIRLDR